MFPIGLQLFTVRDEMAKDPDGTLRRVAAIGYQGIETGRPRHRSAAEERAFLDEIGLQVIALHTSEQELETDLDGLIEDCRVLGTNFVVLSWSPCESFEQWRAAVEKFNAIGQRLAQAGLQFCYHNHSHEFRQFDGKSALDWLWDTTDASYVQAELDTYWIKHGGEDPAAYLAKLTGRCPLLHIKDMADDESRSFAEIGTGILDFAEISRVAASAGCRWLIVEQDQCQRDPLESIAVSLDNLRRLGIAAPVQR